jgi:hypothetical protein
MSNMQGPFITSYSPRQQYHRAPPARRESSRSKVQQRARFAIFIKLLLKRLENSDAMLHEQAKSMVSFCLARNRTKDPNCAELVECVEIPLRELVGEIHWRRSHAYYTQYELTQSNRNSMPVPVQHNVSKRSLDECRM